MKEYWKMSLLFQSFFYLLQSFTISFACIEILLFFFFFFFFLYFEYKTQMIQSSMEEEQE